MPFAYQQRRYASLSYLVLFYLIASFLLRTVLFAFFGPANGVSMAELPVILGIGALNDAIEALYLFLPFAFYLWLMPDKYLNTKAHTYFMGVMSFLFMAVFLYINMTEYYFFDEYSARFNLVAVDYLIYPTEVFTNIWDSYPVAKGGLAAILVAAGIMTRLWPRLKNAPMQASSFSKRSLVFGVHAAVLGLALLLHHTHAFDFSNNRISNELAANGISSIFQAFHTNHLDYNAYYHTEDNAAILPVLTQTLKTPQGDFIALDKGLLNRRFPARADGLGKLNVVVIGEESFGAQFSRSYQDRLNLTPNFDKLAKEGMLFTDMYATGTRTVRGLEAISASFLPIPSEAIVKRPGSEHIANWGEVMKQHGYTSSFLYGGYGAFDNMNYYFKNNGFRISDRMNIEKVTFSNIWGVCDEDLFRHAVRYFNQMAALDKPFFAIVMSTSNHKPYTFPKGIKGIPSQGGGRGAGVRYADYAIGQFFKMARKQPWFDNTLFIIVGDHDARVYGAAKIPVYSYKIPLLFYAPKYIKPQRVDVPTSQIDIAPTVLALLGLGYEAPFYGQDVLHWPKDKPRYIFMNHDHDVAVMKGDELAVLGLRDSTQSYHYDKSSKQMTKIPDNPELIRLATAYYQTAYQQFVDHRYVFLKDLKTTH